MPSVTVVIAAHNEEQTIAQCLSGVLAQSYPPDCLEIVLVDDGSSDDTSKIAHQVATEDSRLKILQLLNNEQQVRGPRKPLAIAAGVENAKGDIIVTTDADCIVTPLWIRSMVKHFDSSTVFVAGPVKEIETQNLLSQLSRIEFLGLIATSAGLIANENPIICNGANIAFRRSAFHQVQGFGDTNGFCDDEVLMHRIKRRALGSIRYDFDAAATVLTKGASTLASFWNQRVRWASKRGHFEDITIIFQLFALYLFFLSTFTLAIFSIVSTTFLPFLLAILSVKLIVEYILLNKAAHIFRQTITLSYFFIAELLHVPYIVFAAFFGQFGQIKWKGHHVRR